MNYEPSPSNFTVDNKPEAYAGIDFWNTDFPALWGSTVNDPDSDAIPRNDLAVIQNLGFDLIKGFNYSDPLVRNHIPFLDECFNRNINVIIPISNTIIIGDIDVISRIIDDAINNIAVVAISIGNNLQGAAAVELIADVFSMIVAQDIMNTLAVCAPLEIPSDIPIFPSEIEAIRNAIISRGLAVEYAQRWFHAINIFNPDAILPILVTHRDDPVFGTQPLLITEYGSPSNPQGELEQKIVIDEQIAIIYGNIGPAFPLFAGGCLYEFTDELWRTGGFGNKEEQSFGIKAFTGDFGEDLTLDGLPYRVDVLADKLVVNSFPIIPI